MRLFKVTTATGQVVYFFADSAEEASAAAAAQSSSFSQNDGGVEVPVGSSETGATGSPVFIAGSGGSQFLGAISATSPLLAFAALGGGSRSPEQIVSDFGSITQTEGNIALGAEPPGGAAPRPTDPFSSETGTAGVGVAFRNALDQAGLGALRGIGRDVESPLTTIFDVGGLAGLTGGPFGGLGGEGREDFAVGDFFRNAINALQSGGATIGQLAGQAFNAPQTAETGRFFNPDFSLQGGTSALRDAEEFAQLARLSARQQFGTVLGRRLTSPQDLVEQFRAQPTGTATADFRDFLASRTQRGFRN